VRPLVCTIVFIETGFFVVFSYGRFLVSYAGIFAAAGVVPLRWLLLPVMACAIVGDQIGYWIGRTAGPALYRREDSMFFSGAALAASARLFMKSTGGAQWIFARFVPIVRTFCPPVTGAAHMPYTPVFLMFDIIGALFGSGR